MAISMVLEKRKREKSEDKSWDFSPRSRHAVFGVIKVLHDTASGAFATRPENLQVKVTLPIKLDVACRISRIKRPSTVGSSYDIKVIADVNGAATAAPEKSKAGQRAIPRNGLSE